MDERIAPEGVAQGAAAAAALGIHAFVERRDQRAQGLFAGCGEDFAQERGGVAVREAGAAVANLGEASGGAPGEVVPLDVMERHMIIKSLDRTEGNRTQAAQLLGISVRTLRNKLNEYREAGIEVE